MRNFSHGFNRNSVQFIDFFKQDVEELAHIKESCIKKLIELSGASVGCYTPSEEEAINDFISWFHSWSSKGFSARSTYDDQPDNTVYAYVNMNSGKSFLFIGVFNEGYGETSVNWDLFHGPLN